MRRTAAALLGLLLSASAGAQVTIVRDLPRRGTNPVRPTWSGPSASEQRAKDDPTQISGTLSLGGSGGVPSPGQFAYDLFTDSALKLVQALGAARLTLDAEAQRYLMLSGKKQSYALDVGLGADLWKVAVSGTYGDDRAEVDEGIDRTVAAGAGAKASIGLIESLPIGLSFSYDFLRKLTMADMADAGTITDDRWTIDAGIKGSGALGRLGIDTSARLQRQSDVGEDLDTLAAGIDVGLRIPFARRFAIAIDVAPAYSSRESHQSETTVTSWKLDSGLGVAFTPIESLELSLLAGRNDSWTSKTDTGDLYLGRWKATFEAAWRGEHGPQANAAYSLGVLAAGGNAESSLLSHTASVDAGWKREGGQEGFLRSASTTGTLSVAGPLQAGWAAQLAVEPARDLTVEGSYRGSLDRDDRAVSSHSAAATLSHAPLDVLSYAAGASVLLERDDSELSTSQSYNAKIALSPLVRGSPCPFTLAENLTLSSEDGTSSALSFDFQLPLLEALRWGYGLSWEWLQSTTSGTGHAFRHLASLRLATETPAVRLSLDYGFLHGRRGMRHEIRSSLTVPIGKLLSLRADVDFRVFEEDGTPVAPFLVRILASHDL